MKRIAACLFAFIIVFSACSSVTAPPSDSPEPSPEVLHIEAVIPEIELSELTLPPEPEPEPSPEPSPEPEPEPEPKPEPDVVTIMAVGDNLIHNTIIDFGRQADGTYNYDALFEGIIADIKAADISCINQETIFINNPAEYTNYPSFGGPTALGSAIADAGIDVVTHATNHVYDKGMTGLRDTLDFWATRPDVTVLGLHDNQEDSESVKIIERNNIKIAMLNYTYGLNGAALPSDKAYMVDTLSTFDEIASDIEKAEAEGDITVVFMHAGDEYVYSPNQYQKNWAEFFSENGVDIIIGAHPHVVQPVEMIETEGGQQTLVYWSLGNFVSHQNQAPRMIGAMANIEITKDESGTYVSDYSISPLVTHIEYGYTFKTMHLEDYTDELAAVHAIRYNVGSDMDVSNLWEIYDSIFE